jgi:hypothetical protein
MNSKFKIVIPNRCEEYVSSPPQVGNAIKRLIITSKVGKLDDVKCYVYERIGVSDSYELLFAIFPASLARRASFTSQEVHTP